MTWTETLEREIDYTYRAARTLMRMVREEDLSWKPAVPEGAESTGWMTTGQLLHHMTDCCGALCHAFLKNEWPTAGEGDAQASPLERMRAVDSVEAALEALERDREAARTAVESAGEERLTTQRVTAPWGIEGTLGQQFLDLVKHLAQHKGQLFYYLKLLGRPVHTGHLWGLEG